MGTYYLSKIMCTRDILEPISARNYIIIGLLFVLPQWPLVLQNRESSVKKWLIKKNYAHQLKWNSQTQTCKVQLRPCKLTRIAWQWRWWIHPQRKIPAPIQACHLKFIRGVSNSHKPNVNGIWSFPFTINSSTNTNACLDTSET